MPDRDINSIQDLVGKKVSYTKPRSTSETVARMAITAAGLDGQIELVSLGKVGAGQTESNIGELLSMMATTMRRGERDEFFRAVDEHLQNEYGKFGIVAPSEAARSAGSSQPAIQPAWIRACM